MHIGYLMNTYPVTSGTFIRREIHALERQGVTVERYAVRRWDQELVDPRDREEQGRTFYLLSGRAPALILSFIAELFANPRGVLGAGRLTLRLIGNAGGGVVRHLAYLMEAASLKRRARKDGITHIHTHFSTNPAAVAMLSAAMGGPGYSFTAHGPDEFVDRSSHSLGLKIERARFVVAISHFSRMTLMLAGGWAARDKIRIVRCGLDLAEFPLSEADFDTGEIVCVGRLCPQKGQTLIPKAVARVAETHPALRVTLIGDGESRAEIEAEIAALGLADRITLLGWQSNAEVRAAISRARALMLPSFAEGLPIVLMEAFALGRPVLTTYIAGIPELVDQSCGWLIPASDDEALAEALADVMATPPERLAEMGRTGGARVEAAHDQHANAAQLKDLIAEAIARDA